MNAELEKLHELSAELERCSDEIWDALPDGGSGIREITVSVSKLSAYVDVMTDAEEALRANETKLAELAMTYSSAMDLVDKLERSLAECEALLRETLGWWDNALKMMRLIVPDDLQWKVEVQTRRIAEIRRKLEGKS